CRSLQRGQRGVLEWPERAGVRIVTSTGVDGDPISLRRSSDFYPTLPSGLRQTLVRRAPLPAPSRPGSATACHLKHLSDDAPMLPARPTRGSLSIRADPAQPAAKRGEAGPSCRSGCARLAPQDRARAFHPRGSDLECTMYPESPWASPPLKRSLPLMRARRRGL